MKTTALVTLSYITVLTHAIPVLIPSTFYAPNDEIDANYPTVVSPSIGYSTHLPPDLPDHKSVSHAPNLGEQQQNEHEKDKMKRNFEDGEALRSFVQHLQLGKHGSNLFKLH